MVIRKLLGIALLLASANAEPPVFGSSGGGYNYQAPSQPFQPPPVQSYSAPSAEYGAPTGVGGYSGSGGYDAHSSYDDGHSGHDNHEPKSYEFGYSVKDAYSGNDYDRQEKSDGNTVTGEYRVQLPDGRTQIVTYHADWKTGFHADVRYEGEARYPEQAPYKSANTAYGPPQESYNYNAQADFGGGGGYQNGNGGGGGYQTGNGGGYDSYSAYSTPKPQYGTPRFH